MYEDNSHQHQEEDNFLTKVWRNGLTFYIDYISQAIFYNIGKFVAHIPVTVCVASIIITIAFGLGIMFIKFESNPQKLWVPDDSETVQQKNYFDENFSPFFRINQLIITSPNSSANVVSQEVFLELWQIQNEVNALSIQDPKNESRTVMLKDICFSPIPSKGCMVQSPLEYFQNSRDNIVKAASVSAFVYDCVVKSGLKPKCRSSIGVPVYYKQAFGQAYLNSNTSTLSANALLVTYLVNNSPDVAYLAEAWEKEFLKVAAKPRDTMIVHYSAERSVQDELDRETSADILTIAISYVAMFIYVALSLGQLHPVKSRVALGLAGVIIVLMSVVISAGICCLIGVKATLIISEVIPFLILAIGVDNMFILANHVDKTDLKLPIPVRVGQALAKVGASMALASVAEFLAFMLGSLTKMPAVQAFCMYAGIAVLANFFLQITAFAALLSIDMRRTKENRLEFEPFIKAPSLSGDWFSISSIIKVFIEKAYAKVILLPPVSVIIVAVFIGLTGFMGYQAMSLEQGLDQATALPSDSYVVDYFKMQREYLDLGPPVFFVTQNLNYTEPTVQDQLMDMMDKVSHTQYIDKGSIMFWLETFKRWVYTSGTIGCISHPLQSDHIPPEKFVPLLQEFLSQTDCCHVSAETTPLCGFQYRQDVKIVDNQVVASRLMCQTTTLVQQNDFINSMKAAYHTTDLLPFTTNSFPYSVYYIYFAQYLYLPEVAAMNILIATGAVLLSTLILLANPISSIYTLLCLIMIDIDLLGMMALLKIYVNSLSVVNLVMSIGISVEFCVHIIKSFLNAKGSHQERAYKSLVEMGSSVFSGITLTKFIGVSVLFFSKSDIFKIYYFKMYLGIVVFGMLHGLVFLPALLSLFGPETAKSNDKDYLAVVTEAEENQNEEPAEIIDEDTKVRRIVHNKMSKTSHVASLSDE